MKTLIAALLLVLPFAASADHEIMAQVNLGEDGQPVIAVETSEDGSVTTLRYTTTITSIPDAIVPAYFFLTLGTVVPPTELPAGCVSSPYGQVQHTPAATEMEFHVMLQGASCAEVIRAFLKNPVGIRYTPVRTDVGADLGPVYVRVNPSAIK